MKKKIIVSSVVLIAMALFVTMQYTIRDFIGTGPKLRAEEPYAQERTGEETKAIKAAAEDAGVLLDNMSKNKADTEKVKKQVKENLQYCLEYFAELRKGDDADIKIVKKVTYSLHFLYDAIIFSDYDGSYTTTEKEKRLWKTRVRQYVDKAKKYADCCSSLTQEEADFLKAQKTGRKIKGDLDKVVDEYVGALEAVVEEAKEKGWV